MRKILTVLLLASIVGGTFYWFYTSFDESNSARTEALRAIPQSAAIVFETDRAGGIWRDLSQTNLIWDELRATDLFFRLDRIGHDLDSLIRKDSEVRKYLTGKPVAVSVHLAGARDFSYLLSLQIASEAEGDEVQEAMVSMMKPSTPIETRTYDGVKIVKLSSRLAEKPLHFFVHEGLLVLSLSPILAEESVRALTQNASILAHSDFQRVRKTRGNDARGQIYVNYKQLKTILAQYVSESYRDIVFFKQAYANWSALDLDIKANEIRLNGFVQSSDSSDAWLSAFKNLDAPEPELLNYMPSNTAYLVFLGYGNYSDYRKRQMELIERANRKYTLENQLQQYSDLCDCDMEAMATSWITSQAASFITEPASEEYAQNQYAVFKTDDGEKALSSLRDLATLLKDNGKGDPEEITYRELPLFRLHIGEFYRNVVGEAFNGITSPYVTAYDDVVLMANSVNALRNLLSALEMKRTLTDSDAFAELKDQLFDDANLIVYSSLARSPEIYSHILKDEYDSAVEEQTDVLRKFQAFVYQVSHYKDELYYNNVYFRHNPDYKQETNSLWEKQLKAAFLGKPHLLRNHYTEALEILVQDDSNRVYLLANTGKVLWERQLDGPIMGEVHQVDVYRNDKLQMLFNTANTVYLFDRNGNDVEKYPIRLKVPASNPVSIADYDNSRDYRFFIGTMDGDVLCFDAIGKAVDGWEYTASKSPLMTPLEHLRIRKKDYLFAVSKAEEILLLSRKGDIRHKVETKATAFKHGGYKVDLGNSISESSLYFVDSTGSAVRIGFDDRIDRIPVTAEKWQDYEFKEIYEGGKPECVILTGNGIYAFTMEGVRVMKHSFEEAGANELQYFRFPENREMFGITNTAENKIYLVDSKGSMMTGFPLFGGVPFVIGDMNRDGYYNLVTASREGFVYAYSINLER